MRIVGRNMAGGRVKEEEWRKERKEDRGKDGRKEERYDDGEKASAKDRRRMLGRRIAEAKTVESMVEGGKENREEGRKEDGGKYWVEGGLPIVPPKWRRTSGTASGNSLSPWKCWLQWFTPLFTRISSSPRSWQDGCPNFGQGDEEEASQDMRGLCSDDRCGSLTILANVSLVVSRLGAKSERVGLTLTQDAS
jgi:hypothetical protein